LLGHDDGSSTSYYTNDTFTITASGSSGNSSGIVWVPVSEGYAKNDDWSADGKTRGYALYDADVWTAAAAGYKSGTDPLTDPDAPDPLLFLPAGGNRSFIPGEGISNTGNFGNYWSSVAYNNYIDSYSTGFYRGGTNMNRLQRARGYSVRCIAE
jgi:hypothetical protein